MMPFRKFMDGEPMKPATENPSATILVVDDNEANRALAAAADECDPAEMPAPRKIHVNGSRIGSKQKCQRWA